MEFDKQFLKSVRDQLKALDTQIAEHTAQRTALQALLPKEVKHITKPKTTPSAPTPINGEASTTTVAPSAPAAPTQASHGGAGTHKGFVIQLLPYMFNRQECSAASMLEYLQAQPGLQGTKRNSLDATLQNEFKKGDRARIARVRPGVFKITQAGIDVLNQAEGVGQPGEAAADTTSESADTQADDGSGIESGGTSAVQVLDEPQQAENEAVHY